MKKNQNTICRPQKHLASVSRDFPNAWKRVKEFRDSRGKDLPNWPDWCYLPLAGSYAIVSEKTRSYHIDITEVENVARVGALVAWRATQGIYRFDPSLYESIISTPVEGNIPCDVLRRMPEWCVYIETPGLKFAGSDVYGAFAYLEWDVNEQHEELRILLDAQTGLTSIIVHVGPWNLEAGLAKINHSLRPSAKMGVESIKWAFGLNFESVQSELVEPILSLLLYICSEAAEMKPEKQRVGRSAARKAKREAGTLSGNTPTTWNVGVRLGAALRRAYAVDAESHREAGSRAGPRPHVRRAHWHTFLTGPRSGEQRRILK